MTFLAAFGAIVARGQEHHEVFALLGVTDWQSRIPEVRQRYGGFQAIDLYPDALPSIAALRDAGIRISVIANQPAERGPELRAIGVDTEVLAMSEEMGVAKPSDAFFVRALRLMGALDPRTWHTWVTGRTTTCGPPRPPVCAPCGSDAAHGASSVPMRRVPRSRSGPWRSSWIESTSCGPPNSTRPVRARRSRRLCRSCLHPERTRRPSSSRFGRSSETRSRRPGRRLSRQGPCPRSRPRPMHRTWR